MDMKLSGGCLCGFIRFTAINPASSHSCSCDMCQKHSGCQTAVWLEFHSSDVEWTGEGGAPSLYRSSAASSRAFCARCGSSIGAIDDNPVIALLSGIFDHNECALFSPHSHSFQDMKPEWWRKIMPDTVV
ncbi:GFA family protein [Lelliottia wanjuensis]|uniref:GFA family protein n=1 Tax=Lelliottia wanjuensis TaxID=3050585 RepID=A0AAP4FTT6_9ENTR|nr:MULTISPECIES: GFA family protein [unclassified Lelliottia]MDK9356581.1 GFA family protein [Lelliottia sp. V106_16]MDK9362435.1 GFA family protein [Lelliottia sp. V106_12]MDK9372663.1 GFA family protein [Lelliottia sp. V106_10]MDK9585296.1 GFA family protein [Lelliottia sp. V86_10]MDK9599467.1 GFA family protein [Lelliottia sp. V106_5]